MHICDFVAFGFFHSFGSLMPSLAGVRSLGTPNAKKFQPLPVQIQPRWWGPASTTAGARTDAASKDTAASRCDDSDGRRQRCSFGPLACTNLRWHVKSVHIIGGNSLTHLFLSSAFHSHRSTIKNYSMRKWLRMQSQSL